MSLSGLDGAPGAAEALGTLHGVTVMYQRAGTKLTSFGASMDDSAFAMRTGRVTVEGVSVGARYGTAGGDLTGPAPAGSATWRGAMAGTPATGNRRGDRLPGDATLTYDLAGAAIDAAFTDIRNVDRLAPHAPPAVRFDNVAVAADRTFAGGRSGNRIQGGLYGPGHAESAGAFEQSGTVGAFGAQRQ